MLLTVNKQKNVLSGLIGNTKYSIEYNSEIHQELLALENRYESATSMEQVKQIIEEAQKVLDGIGNSPVMKQLGEYLVHDVKSDKYFLQSNGVKSSIALPQVLVDRIIEAIEKEIDFLPMVKAWMWFLKNKNFSLAKAHKFAKYITTRYVDYELKAKLIDEGYSEEKAKEMATFTDVAITKNGLIQTYKYVSIKYKKFNSTSGDQDDRYAVTYDEETGEAKVNLPEWAEEYYLIPPVMGDSGDAFYAGEDLGHRVVVGKVHELKDWSQVNCDDRTSCVKGLHLGGRAYIQGYGGKTNLLLNCFVNPMHIGAFTDDGSGAIRVKSYFVHSACFAENKSFYNESTYLEHSNKEWEDIRAEAIKESESKIKQILQLQEEINAL